MKHAPAPWKIDISRSTHIIDADGEDVCRLASDPTRKANARLIASAPDLLRLLKRHEQAPEVLALLKTLEGA